MLCSPGLQFDQVSILVEKDVLVRRPRLHPGFFLMVLFCFYFFDCAGWTRRVLGSLPCRAGGLHTESEGTRSTA